jgi:hypothetical protein
VSKRGFAERSSVDLGSELLELFGPVVEDTKRTDDQEWSERALAEKGVEGDGLKCLELCQV